MKKLMKKYLFFVIGFCHERKVAGGGDVEKDSSHIIFSHIFNLLGL